MAENAPLKMKFNYGGKLMRAISKSFNWADRLSL